jgi:hypothetical protein
VVWPRVSFNSGRAQGGSVAGAVAAMMLWCVSLFAPVLHLKRHSHVASRLAFEHDVKKSCYCATFWPVIQLQIGNIRSD